MRINVLLALTLLTIPAPARPWSEDVMYFMMTDRFADGDPSNNVPVGSDPELYDARQNDLSRYLGGDFRGVENALQDDYFNDLGITALWLTPVVRNVWRSGYDLGGWKTGYHGYWTQDWLDIDPHLTSRKSITGLLYPDNAEGRLRHYQDLVKLAHSKGIKVIQDVVLNHAGPVFYYDSNGDDVFNTQQKDEWVQPFLRDGFHPNAKWANIPAWNAIRTQPDGPRKLLGTPIPTRGTLSRIETYGRKGFSPESLSKNDGEEITCDFFSLRDLWTAPEGEYFDELVDEFVSIYHFYLTTIGVDGLRIDTVKHVHHAFWDAFTSRLRARLGPAAAEKLMFGEIYDGNPETLGRYTWRTDWQQDNRPSLDSVLDFNLCFSAREFLRHEGDSFGSAAALEKSLGDRYAMGSDGRPFFNPHPGADGLNAQQKMITFIENHDGLNRFRVAGVTDVRNRLAQALLLTLPGIPCLYYGAEASLQDTEGKIGQDSESGRLMFFKNTSGRSRSQVRASKSFAEISRMASLRTRMPVLRTGSWLPLWVDSQDGPDDDGVFAFARASTSGEEYAIVVVNASDQPRVTGCGPHQIRLPASLKTAGKMLRPSVMVSEDAATTLESIPSTPQLRLKVPAASLVIYEAVAPTAPPDATSK